jgi:O-antigen ligase
MSILYLSLFIIFSLVAYKNFRLAVGIFIILLPTYLIRFNIGSLPTTLLEVGFFGIFLVWLIKYARRDFKKIFLLFSNYSLLFIAISIFIIFSIVAIFVSGDYYSALGIWRAYFLEPIILFLMLLGRYKQIKRNDLIWFLILSTLSISIYAVIQKITGWGITIPEWIPAETRRVTAFYTTPNAIGLYLAPIVFLSLFKLVDKLGHKRSLIEYVKKITLEPTRLFAFVTLVLSLLAIIFAKSQGALIGLAVGLVVFLFLAGYKKIVITVMTILIVISFLLPSLQSAISFQDQSSKNRLVLWGQSWQYLTKSPTNFILGAGLRQFYDKVQKPTHDWTKIYRHIYPHNIFINFWIEIGLFGMLGFVFITMYLVYLTLKIRKRDLVFGSALFAVLATIIVHGLVDVPYFKNDLVFLFWILAALVVISNKKAFRNS